MPRPATGHCVSLVERGILAGATVRSKVVSEVHYPCKVGYAHGRRTRHCLTKYLWASNDAYATHMATVNLVAFLS
jgi:hypothetical protein